MAAVVFREQIRRAGFEDRVLVTSVGTGSWHIGEPADPRTAKVLADHGYPTEHIAARVDADHLAADLLLAMDASHLHALRRQLGDADKARLLRSFDPAAETRAEIPDPYYGGPNGFEKTLEMIEASMPGLLDWIRIRL